MEAAEQFAPVFYQDVADGAWNDPELRRRDLLAAVNYDGNWDPTDNAENLDDHLLPGIVYYDAVETETSWFLLYSLYHPLDWNSAGWIDHESDMEHVWLYVEKEVDGGLTLRALHTQAHGETFAWTDLAGGFPVEGVTIDAEGERPRIFVEAHGHGPASCAHGGGLPFTEAIDCDPDDDDDMVIYRVDGPPGEPDVSGGGVVEAGYTLVYGYHALWPYRADATLWNELYSYEPGRNTDGDWYNDLAIVADLGLEFDGDEGGGGGLPPWAYEIDDDYHGGVVWGARGDWLVDPAALFATMYRDYSCSDRDAFWNYLDNPYLLDLGGPAAGTDGGHRCDGWVVRPDSGWTDTATPGPTDSGAPADSAAAASDEPGKAVQPEGCGCATPSAAALPVASIGLVCLHAAAGRVRHLLAPGRRR